MQSQPFTQITDKDITKETSPSLDIMRDIIQEIIFPTWNSVAYYMTSNYPKFHGCSVSFSAKKLRNPTANTSQEAQVANSLPILRHTVCSCIKRITE
ncbi:MAG: hypothetical protein CM1200mP28_09070 [Deltaproteobacteria bacterium]|nr:MAG: hypothetical protein CM1200mP28_09070 [Deltaproteobacteria bacterium]